MSSRVQYPLVGGFIEGGLVCTSPPLPLPLPFLWLMLSMYRSTQHMWLVTFTLSLPHLSSFTMFKLTLASTFTSASASASLWLSRHGPDHYGVLGQDWIGLGCYQHSSGLDSTKVFTIVYVISNAISPPSTLISSEVSMWTEIEKISCLYVPYCY